MRNSFDFFFHTLQESWSKEFGAAANVVANLGYDALSLLAQFEKAGTNLTGGLLRSAFEGLIIPDDQQTLINRLNLYKGKYTGSILRDTATAVKEERMWRWIVCHKMMPDDKVHPTRSVYRPSLIVPTVSVLCLACHGPCQVKFICHCVLIHCVYEKVVMYRNCDSCSHITGNEGEIEALKHMVQVKDIKVSQQGWKFSDRSPEPPLANVMNTGFWSLPHYEPLRQRLARPVLEVQLKPGGDFLTVSTQGEGKVSEAVLTQEGEATQVHFPSPSSVFGFMNSFLENIHLVTLRVHKHSF